VMDVLEIHLEIGSCKLFARAGFELWSSWSLPPELLELQVWAICAQLGLQILYWGFLHLYSSRNLVCNFRFWCIFTWFWFYCNTGFLEWVW
jgi:hypothetical protein